MKNFKKFAFALLILPLFANASSDFTDVSDDVANSLSTIKVETVKAKGTVLRKRHQHPNTKYLIGIPATVQTGSACTKYVGQEKTVVNNVATIRAVGSADTLNEVCVMILPKPVSTVLSFEMNVLTGGFVPAQRYQTAQVNIAGKGFFVVTLDMQTDTVSIAPKAFTR